MSQKPSIRIRREGAYFVKAAESPSTSVKPRTTGRKVKPSGNDKKLVNALLRTKQS